MQKVSDITVTTASPNRAISPFPCCEAGFGSPVQQEVVQHSWMLGRLVIPESECTLCAQGVYNPFLSEYKKTAKGR